MLRKKLLPGKRCLGLAMSFVLCSSMSAYALEAPPNAGTIADSVKERRIAIPPKANVQIEVSGEQEEVQPQKTGYKIKVRGFHITGQTIYSEEKLQALVKDQTNRELTLSELEAAARSIAMYFRDHGYMVANAYIPAQDINNGTVEITVVPGRFGNLEVRNNSTLSDAEVGKMLKGIKSGAYVKKDKLERTLLLLSDVGGIGIKATLVPGKANGTTDLIVEINKTDRVNAEISMDNYGNRFTGKDLRSLHLDIHNLTHIGDEGKLNINNSGGNLNNAGGSYTMPIGGQGAKLGVGYSRLHYSLDQEFETLNFNGESKDTSIFASYPIVRSRNYNLYGRIGYDHRQIQDRTYDIYFTDKHSNVWSLGLSGDSRDKKGGGGVNSFALTFSVGRLAFDGGRDISGFTPEYQDSISAQTAGTFTKVNLDFSRLQYINNKLNLYLGLTGQMANKNLDASEKLYLGGAYGVRAYPQGEASGDQGYLLSAEMRYQMADPSLQLTAFIDHGHVDGNRNNYLGAADSRTLTGAGLGVIFSHRKDYAVRLDYAWKLGSDKESSDNERNGRLWIRGVQYF